MKVHEDRNGFFLPTFVNYCRMIAKKVDFGVLVLNHSSNNTVFCLHGFLESQKNSVSGGVPVFDNLISKMIFCVLLCGM